jgi:mannitol/fructose-specific phosphotransferase system IIA component (Ntr-type)
LTKSSNLLNPRAYAVVLISDILTSMRVKVPLEAKTKDEVLVELVDVLAGDGCVRSPNEVLRVVQAREQVLSTGIGHGVALPHGKSDVCAQLLIAAGVAPHGIEFDALDAEPVRLIFLLVGPESEAGPHIKALSQISHLVRRADVRDRLLGAADAGSFLQALRDAEAA